MNANSKQEGPEGEAAQSGPDTTPLTGKPIEQKAPSVKKSKKSASAFRTISEVANELDVQQHVLRFWETKFSQIKPLKRGGGRRYYRPEDIDLLKTIHRLLYSEGYTIKGVQKLLKENGKKQIIETRMPPGNSNQEQAAEQGLNQKQRKVLQSMLSELKELRGMIEG